MSQPLLVPSWATLSTTHALGMLPIAVSMHRAAPSEMLLLVRLGLWMLQHAEAAVQCTALAGQQLLHNVLLHHESKC